MADLRVADLDFDNIKENLKTFLQGQSYFTDYDFDGSALSILMDMLAYDTHYKAYLANMVINERFIDTAVKRASVISHAKTLGYVPRSLRSACAIVDLTVYGISQDYTMNIDRFTPFSCDIDGETFTFVTIKSYTTTPSGTYNSYTFKDVELYEGTPMTYNHNVAESGSGLMFKIPSLNADTNTLTVVVQTSATDTSSFVYKYADAVSLVKGTDKVYYLEEGTDGYFYIYFGDDVLGQSLKAGNIVKLSYLISKGSAANIGSLYPQQFKLAASINGYFNDKVIITTTRNSMGGSDKQEIDEIRFLAPKNYSAQGRTVTAEDYKTLLVKEFPEIDSISVWGGEDNSPPIYGKVFIAIKPKLGYVLNSTTKEYIVQYLKKRSIVSIQYEFVDPDFTFITVTSNVKFNSNLTVKDSAYISESVKSAIKLFFEGTLQQFDRKLYISKLQSLIDTVDESILGNNISLGLQKRIEPVLLLTSSYSLYFNNKITPYSIYSSAFNIFHGDTTVTVAIKDIPNDTPPDSNGEGKLVLFDISKLTTIQTIGTVNYATGKVQLDSLLVSNYPSSYLYDIRINCKPQENIDEISNNVSGLIKTVASIPVPMQNQILMLDDSIAVDGYNLNNGLTVTATPV